MEIGNCSNVIDCVDRIRGCDGEMRIGNMTLDGYI